MQDHEYNHGWRWAIAFALGTVFFAAHYAGQKLGVIPGPHVDAVGEEKDRAVALALKHVETQTFKDV